SRIVSASFSSGLRSSPPKSLFSSQDNAATAPEVEYENRVGARRDGRWTTQTPRASHTGCGASSARAGERSASNSWNVRSDVSPVTESERNPPSKESAANHSAGSPPAADAAWNACTEANSLCG